MTLFWTFLSLKLFGNSCSNSYIPVYYEYSGFVSLVVKEKMGKTSKILKKLVPMVVDSKDVTNNKKFWKIAKPLFIEKAPAQLLYTSSETN